MLETKKNREIGNTIHITGHLLEDESVRKINILDFRILFISDHYVCEIKNLVIQNFLINEVFDL